ncbi:hypothetical protein TspCOW1_08810 [Thiohalobacter sp. COW1]|nr:hypothetical protein TspCOW1_08810 [Thiohalobacter sp. COW1]
MFDREVYVTAYADGYRMADRHPKDKKMMIPFVGSTVERLKYLSLIAVSCSHKKKVEVKLLPLYKALYDEASDIAKTPEEKRMALYRLRDIERLELGSEQAWEKYREREKKIDQ